MFSLDTELLINFYYPEGQRCQQPVLTVSTHLSSSVALFVLLAGVAWAWLVWFNLENNEHQTVTCMYATWVYALVRMAIVRYVHTRCGASVSLHRTIFA